MVCGVSLDPLEAAAAKTRELVTSLQFSLSLLKISLFCTNTCTVECCVVDLWQSGGSEERHPFFPASYFVPQQQKKESKEERQRENESRGRRKNVNLLGESCTGWISSSIVDGVALTVEGVCCLLLSVSRKKSSFSTNHNPNTYHRTLHYSATVGKRRRRSSCIH